LSGCGKTQYGLKSKTVFSGSKNGNVPLNQTIMLRHLLKNWFWNYLAEKKLIMKQEDIFKLNVHRILLNILILISKKSSVMTGTNLTCGVMFLM
jgi:hypothetical protein